MGMGFGGGPMWGGGGGGGGRRMRRRWSGGRRLHGGAPFAGIPAELVMPVTKPRQDRARSRRARSATFTHRSPDHRR